MEQETKNGKKYSLDALDATQASNKGVEIELRHPGNNEPLGIFITVIGKDSDTFREMSRRNFDDMAREEARAKQRNKPIPVRLSSDYEDTTTELLVACTKGWREMEWKGKPLPFSPENASMIYTERSWVRDQVFDAITDITNFMRG